jgi:predicted DNA-binding transcriptional regulator AlpA
MPHPNASSPPPQSATTRTPWLMLGISKSTWLRLWYRRKVPAPIKLPGLHLNVWRCSDVLAFLEGLPTLDQPRPGKPGAGGPRKSAG